MAFGSFDNQITHRGYVTKQRKNVHSVIGLQLRRGTFPATCVTLSAELVLDCAPTDVLTGSRLLLIPHLYVK